VEAPDLATIKVFLGGGFLYSTEDYCEGGPELEPRRRDIALPILASERRAATLTPGRVPQRCRYITVLVYLGTEWLEAWLMDNETMILLWARAIARAKE
jgi:hypothetical protein